MEELRSRGFEDLRDELNRRRVIEEQRVLKRKVNSWADRVPGLEVEIRRDYIDGECGAVGLILSRAIEEGEERRWTGFNFASQSIQRAEEIVRRWEVQA